MCGLAGIIDFTGSVPSEQQVKSMNNTIARRGPDGEGIVVIPYMGFGHRRLSIIDLSERGAQPMTNVNKKRWIVFNGEIYNYKQLRSELINENIKFNSSSDTEVILLGSMFWGFEKFLQKARGMWAFAIWDGDKKELTLSRDRFGKKPLYYVIKKNKVIFGTSLNVIKSSGEITEAIDKIALSSYLSFGYIPSDECIYEHVQKVPESSYLVFRKGIAPIIKKYWELKYKEVNTDVSNASMTIDSLLKKAIKDRLVADVDVGAFLSGGLDSALLTKIAAGLKPKIRTYTMKVDGWRNETERAQIIVDQIKSNHQLIDVDSSEIEILPDLIAAYGEPFADSSMIPTALVSKKSSETIKVVLTGDGGDESFGTYGEPENFRNIKFETSKYPVLLSSLLHKLINHRSLNHLDKGRAFEKKLAVGASGVKGYLDTLKTLDNITARLILGDSLKKLFIQNETVARYLSKTPDMPEWRKLMHVQLRLRLQSCFLVKLDVASMHFGLEARSPLLDHRLVEYVFGLSYENWSFSGPPKGIFSDLASKYLPKRFINFPKHGFSIPVEEYIAGPWKHLFLDLIRNGVAEQSGYINSKGIEKLLEKFRSDIPTRISNILFTVLCLEIWLRQQKNVFDSNNFKQNIKI